ncbi:MAG TPA: hypothetical protein VN804_04195, partial [Solirubrobacteraceae bacterium]|nr:hypothetical protein [Solirubrobacteraceae bacterium]
MPAAPTEPARRAATQAFPADAASGSPTTRPGVDELLLDRAVAEIATPPGAGASGWPARLL